MHKVAMILIIAHVPIAFSAYVEGLSVLSAWDHIICPSSQKLHHISSVHAD